MAEPERERMTWPELGSSCRALAELVHDDGYQPDMVLAVARGGLLVAGALSYALGVKNTYTMNVEFYTGKVAEVRAAVLYEKPRSIVRSEYVWRRTDRWIDFPWSVEAPVGAAV